jgi:hypothetical protein
MNQLIITRERETIGKMTDKANENTGMILLIQLLIQLLLQLLLQSNYVVVIIIIIFN